MIAWMLYHLKNDQEAKTVFYGDDAEVLNNSNWKNMEKNQQVSWLKMFMVALRNMTITKIVILQPQFYVIF